MQKFFTSSRCFFCNSASESSLISENFILLIGLSPLYERATKRLSVGQAESFAGESQRATSYFKQNMTRLDDGNPMIYWAFPFLAWFQVFGHELMRKNSNPYLSFPLQVILWQHGRLQFDWKSFCPGIRTVFRIPRKQLCCHGVCTPNSTLCTLRNFVRDGSNFA